MTMHFESTAKLVRRYIWLQRSCMVLVVLTVILTGLAVYLGHWLLAAIDAVCALILLWLILWHWRIIREIERRTH